MGPAGLVRTAVRALHPLVAALDPCPPVGDADQVLAQTPHFYVALDDDGVVLSWNQAATDLFGYPPSYALGRSLEDLIVPARHHAAHRAGIEHYRRTGRGRGIGSAVEVEALRSDGSVVPVSLSIWAQHSGSTTVFHALGHDLSGRRRNDDALRLLAQHRQALLVTDSPVGVRDVLCRTVREVASCEGVYLYEPDGRREDGLHVRLTAQATTLGAPGASGVVLDDALLAQLDDRDVLSGLARPAVPGRPSGRRGTGVTPDRFTAADGADALRRTGLQTFVVRPLRHDGELVGVLLLGWIADRRPVGDPQVLDLLASEAILVLDRLSTHARLQRAARTDPLTGVWNRREWGLRLDDAVRRAEQDGTPLTLLVMDLDRFKAYNDDHGHPAGDALLVEATARWQEVVPGEGLARTGGDEFAVALPGLDATGGGGGRTGAAGRDAGGGGTDAGPGRARERRVQRPASAPGRCRPLRAQAGPPGQGRRRSRLRCMASVPCRCGHSCTAGPAPRSGTPARSGRASSCSRPG